MRLKIVEANQLTVNFAGQKSNANRASVNLNCPTRSFKKIGESMTTATDIEAANSQRYGQNVRHNKSGLS